MTRAGVVAARVVAAGVVAVLACGAALPAVAAEPAHDWAFALTAYPTDVRDGDRFTSFIAAADHGSLHLEARHNYESMHTTSAFVGWTFAGEGEVSWSVRPLLGGAWGDVRAFVPGLQASVAVQRFDAYVEAEYVRDRRVHEDSYFYAWSELGFRAADWLRVGIAGQRTRLYDNSRDIQRGPFVQLTWQNLTVGGYWFNPGSQQQVFVGSIGVTF